MDTIEQGCGRRNVEADAEGVRRAVTLRADLWTTEEVQTLLVLARGGASRADMAKAVGRSRDAVSNRLARMRFRRPAPIQQIWPDGIEEPGRNLALTHGQVADLVGCSPRRVRRWRQAHGLQRPSSVETYSQRERAILADVTLTHQEAAARLPGRTVPAVATKRKRMGVQAVTSRERVRGEPWTEAEIDTLREMASRGHSAREIAVALHRRSRSAVLGMAHRHAIRLKGGSPCKPFSCSSSRWGSQGPAAKAARRRSLAPASALPASSSK